MCILKINPAISVVMSVYNSEKYIAEAIESILGQTFADFEFIIINDGSTDESLNIIKKYMKKDERIVLISRENKGLPCSLNEGISLAKAKYIARMDADDLSLPNRFEEQFEFMELNDDIGICGTWAESFGEGVKPKLMKYPKYHEELEVVLLFAVCFAHPTVMIRKQILDHNDLKYNEDYSNSQDYELWEKLSHVTKMANLQKPLLRYRVSSYSITGIVDSTKSELRYQLVSTVFKKILCNVGVQNNDKNNRLHFALGLNARIFDENIDLMFLHLYFRSIIKMNNSNNYFNKDYLVKYLSRKFLITFFYHIKKKNFKVNVILLLRYSYSFICVNVKHKVFG